MAARKAKSINVEVETRIAVQNLAVEEFCREMKADLEARVRRGERGLLEGPALNAAFHTRLVKDVTTFPRSQAVSIACRLLMYWYQRRQKQKHRQAAVAQVH